MLRPNGSQAGLALYKRYLREEQRLLAAQPVEGYPDRQPLAREELLDPLMVQPHLLSRWRATPRSWRSKPASTTSSSSHRSANNAIRTGEITTSYLDRAPWPW
jgi:hypothetical protein